MMLKNGAEQESVVLLNDRLKVRPQWASSVFVPPGGKGWICMRSNSRESVEKLCLHLSTFPHPLHIIFLPVKERWEWLNYCHHAPRIPHPAWVRIKQKSELGDLLSSGWNFDKRVMKYAKDLAYVPFSNETSVIVCLVPRLPVLNSNGDSGEGESKRRPKMQQLLHPMMLGDPQAASRATMIDPSMWWQPKTRYDLKKIGAGVYQLVKPENQRTVKGADDFTPPFASFVVPPVVLQSTGVVPRLSELKFFGEAMAIGSKQLHLPNPGPDFLRWRYENHIAAPVLIGHKAEAKVEGGIVRGVVVDVFSNEATLCINNTEEIAVDVRCIRRFYEIGDTVKVVKASNLNHEGWVVSIHEGEIDVLDRQAKEHVGCRFIRQTSMTNFELKQFHVKCWQLIPHDGFEWGLPHRIEVGDYVRVISRISADYGERGRVCNVTELGVEVIGDRANTKVNAYFKLSIAR